MTSDLSENMKDALRDLPLVRLWGGFWVNVDEDIGVYDTKQEARKALAGIESHGTNTIKALRRRGLVTLERGDSPDGPATGVPGTVARLTDGAEEVLPGDLAGGRENEE